MAKINPYTAQHDRTLLIVAPFLLVFANLSISSSLGAIARVAGHRRLLIFIPIIGRERIRRSFENASAASFIGRVSGFITKISLILRRGYKRPQRSRVPD
jgi:hypothetical protein